MSRLIVLVLMIAVPLSAQQRMTMEQMQAEAEREKAKQTLIESIRATPPPKAVKKPAPKELTAEEKKALAENAAYQKAQNSAAGRKARSPQGLLIVSFKNLPGGITSVTLRNITRSTVEFDFRQMRGAELDGGEVVPGSEIRYLLQERSSTSVQAGEQRTFQVIFNGRGLGALSWTGVEGWVDGKGVPVAKKEDAIAAVLKVHAERRAKERGANLIPVKEGYVPVVAK